MTDQNTEVMSQEDEMAELLAIHEAEARAKKDAENNKGTYTEFEHVECLGLEDKKEKAFRIVGRGFQNRKLPTDAKMVMQSSIRTDEGKGYTKINWPIIYKEGKGDYFPDPDWIFTRLYDKINEGKSAKYTEADIDGKKIKRVGDKIVNVENFNKEWYWNPYHKDTDVYMRVSSNMRDNPTPKEFAPKFYPGKRIVLNVIDRMDDWCIVNKHTKELSSKVTHSEKKNDKGETIKAVYPELGVPKLCYDSIINHYLKTSGSFTVLDTVVVKDSSNKKYDIYDAMDERYLTPETMALTNSGSLSDEEKAYELYDFDDLYRVASYAKLKKNLGGLFKLCDIDLGTHFYDELVNLCKIEDDQKKAEEKIKAELEASQEKFYWIHPESCCCGIEKTREDMDKTLGSDQCVTECFKEDYEAYKKSLEPVQAEEPKTRTREARQSVTNQGVSQKSLDDLCAENFPSWNTVPLNERVIMLNSINSFNGTVPVYTKEAKDVLCNDETCKFKDSTEETTFPAAMFTCPVCGKKEEN